MKTQPSFSVIALLLVLVSAPLLAQVKLTPAVKPAITTGTTTARKPVSGAITTKTAAGATATKSVTGTSSQKTQGGAIGKPAATTTTTLATGATAASTTLTAPKPAANDSGWVYKAPEGTAPTPTATTATSGTITGVQKILQRTGITGVFFFKGGISYGATYYHTSKFGKAYNFSLLYVGKKNSDGEATTPTILLLVSKKIGALPFTVGVNVSAGAAPYYVPKVSKSPTYGSYFEYDTKRTIKSGIGLQVSTQAAKNIDTFLIFNSQTKFGLGVVYKLG